MDCDWYYNLASRCHCRTVDKEREGNKTGFEGTSDVMEDDAGVKVRLPSLTSELK